MHALVLVTLSTLVCLMSMKEVETSGESPLLGRFQGTSAFVPSRLDEAGYADTIPIWFVFEPEMYIYGEGETLPTDELYGDGGGPYEWTDSTVTLNGAYPKILRPVIVLRGTFSWRFDGDTLTLAQPADSSAETGHRLRLVRQ